MPITPAQLEQRKKSIGSSDMPALMGVDAYKNAADVYHAKVGNVPDYLDDEEVNEAAEAGNYLEPSVLAWASAQLGVKIRKNQRRVKGYFAANLDALIVGRREALEAKTTGLYNPMFFAEDWGDPGTDEVPPRVKVQAHHQMLCADLERVWVPALINGKGLVLYRLERSDYLIGEIEEVGIHFWEEHVLKRIPPEDVVPNLDTIKRLTRQPTKTVELDDRLFLAYLEAKEAAKLAAKDLDEKKAAVLDALGDAEMGESNVGTLTYYEQTQNRVDTKLLKEKHPDIAAEVSKQVTFRVAREKVQK